MNKFPLAASLAAIAIVASAAFEPVAAKQRTVIEQLPPEIVDKNYVDHVEVILADTAAAKMSELDTKAGGKRVEAGLAAYDPAVVPTHDQYATLPFSAMMPFVMRDVTRKWGLTQERGGKAVSLRITIENIKTANAGMALLLGSSDELSGEVVVIDPATQQSLGNFYVQVVNAHSGLAGLAMRGAGIREKLAEEFALESARILTGSTKKDWKKRVKAGEKVAGEKPAATAAAGA